MGVALEEMRQDEGFDTVSCRSDPVRNLPNGAFLKKKNGGIIDTQSYLCFKCIA